MNRVIEFNAWLPEIGYMMEDVSFGHGQIGFPSDDEGFKNHLISKGFNPDECEIPSWLYDTGEDWYYITEPSKFVLLQYTGLKDRNGKMIFEGHVVKEDFQQDGTYRTLGVVEFYEGSFGSRNHHERFRIPALFSGKATEGMNLNYYEITGDIFQNPELLSNEK